MKISELPEIFLLASNSVFSQEMNERQEDRVKWMEDIYWIHFKYHSFTQSLTGDFHQHLAIPSKFSEKSNGNLPNNVTLVGPSGGSWNVGLVRENGTLFFKHGWGQFVKDHSLHENDLLAFMYSRDSYFQVLIFDGMNLCEKEASYFVRSRETAEHNSCRTKRKDRGSSIENFIHNSDDEYVGSTSSDKSTDYSSHRMSRGQLIISEVRRRTRTKSLRSRRTIGRSAEASTSAWGVKPTFASDKRIVGEDQKMRAIQMAEAALTNDSFLSIMRPNQVHKIFYLGVPKKWLTEHLPLTTKKVNLRVGSRTWEVDYRYYHSGGCGRFSGGWEKFVMDNNLEEYDVCLLKHASSEGDTVTVDVTIFRVAEQETPPPIAESVPPTGVTLKSVSGQMSLERPSTKIALNSGSGKEKLETPTAESVLHPARTALRYGSGLENLPEAGVGTSYGARQEISSDRERKQLHQAIDLNE